MRDGELVYDKGLGDLGEITAIVAEGDTLLVAGWVGGDDQAGVLDVARRITTVPEDLVQLN